MFRQPDILIALWVEEKFVSPPFRYFPQSGPKTVLIGKREYETSSRKTPLYEKLVSSIGLTPFFELVINNSTQAPIQDKAQISKVMLASSSFFTHHCAEGRPQDRRRHRCNRPFHMPFSEKRQTRNRNDFGMTICAVRRSTLPIIEQPATDLSNAPDLARTVTVTST